MFLNRHFPKVICSRVQKQMKSALPFPCSAFPWKKPAVGQVASWHPMARVLRAHSTIYYMNHARLWVGCCAVSCRSTPARADVEGMVLGGLWSHVQQSVTHTPAHSHGSSSLHARGMVHTAEKQNKTVVALKLVILGVINAQVMIPEIWFSNKFRCG